MTTVTDPLDPTSSLGGLIAVDIGNARMKFGWFADGSTASTADHPVPEPDAVLQLDGRRPAFDRLAAWLNSHSGGLLRWLIGSVNRPTTTRLLDWVREHRTADVARLLSSSDLALDVRGLEADMVGVDRLIDAVAANALRRPGRAAVVVDVGTAVTVDLVDADGAFRGGAILPGIAMSARALHEFTDLLPRLDMRDLGEPPPVLGRSTDDAMRAGLFWMAVGTIRELAARLVADQAEEPDLLISGGAGVAVADLLGPRARHVPHLTLGGIALSLGSVDWSDLA